MTIYESIRVGSNAPYDLDSLVQTYDIDNPYEQYKRLEFLKKLGGYLSLDSATVLELGSATGQMTAMLARQSRQVMAVDGSREFIRIASERTRDATNVSYCESCFETISLATTFDCLIMHHVLEHIEKPLELLPKLRSLMGETGIIAITVPNAHALSRQLAVKMGLLASVYELTENDRNHGHFRVYDWNSLEAQVTASGFTLIGRHGLSFKLFSDKQNNEMLNAMIIGEEQIRGLWSLADDFPELAGAIMVIAKPS